jgi:preprotein translocase subunit YajC
LVGAIFQQEGFCKVLMLAQGVIGILAAILWQSGLGSWMGIVPLIFIFAVFYFLLILPQQRRQKKWQAMLDTLKTGDKVVTSGGLRGTIFAMKDDSVTLRVPPDNLKLEVTRGSIVSVTTEEITTK